MRARMTYTTADGGSVDMTRVGETYDMHVRNAAGEPIATVRLSEGAALALVDRLESELP